MKKVKLILGFVLLAVVSVALGVGPVPSSLAQGPGQLPLGQDALVHDAKRYAARFGVDLDEAIRRLELQGMIRGLSAELVEREPDAFAGLWLQHTPEFRLIVQFTHNSEKLAQQYLQNRPYASIVETRTASVPLLKLRAARSVAAQMMHKLGIPGFSATNVRKNRAELYVLDPLQLDTALQRANLQLPADVEVVQVNELPEKVTDIFGGLDLSTCTSGFSVKNSSGTKGITTAGHCGNRQTYGGVQLTFQSGTPDDNPPPFDIQWHTAPGFTVRNLVFDGTYNRYIYSVTFRVAQEVGEHVCKYGMITEGGCGTIVLIDIDGANVAVDIPVDNGDSGGPWFWGNSAYGTTISKCTFGDGSRGAIYGPVDQIYNILGLSILTN